ncbi:HIT family protein [Congregibacter litoralis]|uniref:Diadenosine tetraphosphate (Ap4A) hydrolase and other HIT family hydrolase n=1 Tax=Congregibacter litoralis KT71 TaxID=314285 RepID=A4A8W5_9GAMM|nr:HIT family protein [Congregibacter litoralis]EAQ97507.2 Diadenosine tetraphosphate (Ap4A) hydrolase and other HIT family hydrolase [Congregibacter litoralis KT71]
MTTRKQWQLHPTLARDCHVLGGTADVELLLHRNALLHWFILVPHTSALDLLDLPDHEREALLNQARGVSDYLKQTLDYPRVNVGALGLVVPQLHLHVVGRREGDPCWPAPVWGNLDAGSSYTSAQIDELTKAMNALGLGNA